MSFLSFMFPKLKLITTCESLLKIIMYYKCDWRLFHVSGQIFAYCFLRKGETAFVKTTFYNIKMRISLSFWIYQYYQWLIFYSCDKNISFLKCLHVNISVLKHMGIIKVTGDFLSSIWIKFFSQSHSCILRIIVVIQYCIILKFYK